MGHFLTGQSQKAIRFQIQIPYESQPAPTKVPLCIGQEHECVLEIFQVSPNNQDWKIRVIQNLYPVLSRNLHEPPTSSLDFGHTIGNCVLDGFGFHDVVIETPIHCVLLSDLSPKQIGQVLLAYKKRIEQLASHEPIKYV